jgi:hypothetical protein
MGGVAANEGGSGFCDRNGARITTRPKLAPVHVPTAEASRAATLVGKGVFGGKIAAGIAKARTVLCTDSSCAVGTLRANFIALTPFVPTAQMPTSQSVQKGKPAPGGLSSFNGAIGLLVRGFEHRFFRVKKLLVFCRPMQCSG